MVRQIEDTYEAKSERMILYLQKVHDLLRKFVLVQVKYVPRAENSRADALEKLATASQEDLGRSTPVEYMAEPSINPYSMVVAPVESVPSWMDPIWNYIIDGSLPENPKEAAKIRARSAGSLIIKEASTSEDFSHPSSNASRERTPSTC